MPVYKEDTFTVTLLRFGSITLHVERKNHVCVCVCDTVLGTFDSFPITP